ncbi:MAG: UDP-N-acetylmuramate dehydrogenase [Bacteroidota bacterium]|nr:UDP-N-acetylmuramate dehydrogenase [Candidatus Kapabacteria bacterium]MDW8218948.1 UDP-N-acetylmuramate dehydrogenase [Bacteroidota bacterium]
MHNLIRWNYSLQPHNTFGLHAFARAFAYARSIDELQMLLSVQAPKFATTKILGGGSNIVLTGDLDALVIKIALQGITVLEESATTLDIEIAAGEEWDTIVRYAVQRNWGGIENLSCIPGTVGAAPVQNIGAYGVELCEYVRTVKCIARSTGEIFELSNAECLFGYRDSIFKHALREEAIITSLVLRLRKNPQLGDLRLHYGTVEQELHSLFPHVSRNSYTIRHVREAVSSIRRSKLPDPTTVGNAGSFFKNPDIPLEHYRLLQARYPEIPGFILSGTRVKVPAAWMIEQCGWKGKRLHAHSDAAVHDRQSLVLVNYGRAHGKEIVELSQQIQQSVRERFGIDLVPEVNIW